jgi:hypothetical protein
MQISSRRCRLIERSCCRIDFQVQPTPGGVSPGLYKVGAGLQLSTYLAGVLSVIKKADGLGRAASIAHRLRQIPVKNPTGSLHGTIYGSGGSRSRGPCPTNTPLLPPRTSVQYNRSPLFNLQSEPTAYFCCPSILYLTGARSGSKLNGVC